MRTSLKVMMLCACLFPGAAMAEGEEGVPFYAGATDLAAICKVGGGNVALQAACQNYVTGVVDAWSLVRINEPKLSPHLGCIAHSANPNVLRQIVSKYVADNPTKLDKPAVFIVREAVLKAYPCPKKK